MKTPMLGAVGLLALSVAGSGVRAQIPDNPVPSRPGFTFPGDPNDRFGRQALGTDGPAAHREPRVLSKGPLAAAAEDRDAFRDFLRDNRTGLLRLLPREYYDSETYHVRDVIKIRGGGAYYSFARLTHAYGYGSDIQLERGTLAVGFAGGDYGVLQNLGDVPLAEVTLNDPRTSVLVNYRAAKTEAQARAAYYQLQRGVVINGELYQSRLPLFVNATYLLRSIVYGRYDVLVAFRVVRQDDDGSVIILWKLLKKYS